MNKRTRSTKSEKWRHTCNSVEIAWTNEQKVAVTSYGRNKNHDDEIKKHSRSSPDVQFKEFSLTKQKKLDLEWNISELRKPFKKIRKKNKKKQKINVKMPHVNKENYCREIKI